MKIVLLTFAVATVPLSGLVAASAAHAVAAKPTRAKYFCNKGQSLKVVFLKSKAIVTPKGSKTITLPQGMAADGFLYTKGKYSLRGRGNRATWTSGWGKPLTCKARG